MIENHLSCITNNFEQKDIDVELERTEPKVTVTTVQKRSLARDETRDDIT